MIGRGKLKSYINGPTLASLTIFIKIKNNNKKTIIKHRLYNHYNNYEYFQINLAAYKDNDKSKKSCSTVFLLKFGISKFSAPSA